MFKGIVECNWNLEPTAGWGNSEYQESIIEENRDNLRKERQEIEAKIIELNGRIPDKDCGSTIVVPDKDCGFLGC